MISVLIPVYNAERYLRECLEAVLQQTYQDFEIVLADDGSTDCSLDICREYAQKDARIRFYSQLHCGVSAARNKALEMAEGEYLFFMDSDDKLHPSILSVLYEQLRAYDAEMAFCRYLVWNGEKGTEPEYKNIAKSSFLWDNHRLADVFSNDKNHLFGGVGGKLVKKAAIGTLRFDKELCLGEDTLFLYGLIQKGIRAVYTAEQLYIYRSGSGVSASLREQREGILSACRVIQKIQQGETLCGRTQNAENWEKEYVKVLGDAVHRLKGSERFGMRRLVGKRLGNPYFKRQPLRTRTALFLAFYCPALYEAAKRGMRGLGKGLEGAFAGKFAQKSRCCGCMACAAACRYGAITAKTDGEGFVYPKIDKKKCTGCGRCREVCPVRHPGTGEGENLYLGAQAREEAVRFASSSGGVFPVLANYMLAQGGVVFGAAMEKDGTIRHREAQTPEELAPLCKTKYVQSDLSGCYQRIQHYLGEGKGVLFTGTPCQCRAVSLYIGEDSRLLLADLVCYGTPSPGIWKKYRGELEKAHKGKLTGFWFRDKQNRDNGQTVSMRIGGKQLQTPMGKNLFCRLYFKNLILRPSCHDCAFCTVNRKSDITLGDFWGIERVRPKMQDGMGTSMVILHSQKAVLAWEAVKESFRHFSCQREEILQPRLQGPTPRSKSRMRFMFLSRFLPLEVAEKMSKG